MKKAIVVLDRILNKMSTTAAAAIMFTVLAGSAIDLSAADDTQHHDSTPIDISVTRTLASNPRLVELKQNREAVQKDLRQTKGRYYPRVDIDVGYGTDSHSDLGTRSRGEENDFDSRGEASIKLVQPLYHGGEIDSLVEKQTAKHDSVNHRVYDNAESLALDAIIAHLEVWRQRRLLALTRQNITTHEKILDNISERQRAGAGSSADVVQTKGRLAMTRSSYTRIAGDLESARVAYHRVVGRYPEKLQLPGNFRQLAPTGPDAALNVAQVCNPKLAALAADIRAAKSQIGAAKSNYWPKVNLELSSTYQDQVESSTTYTHNNAAMVRAQWNLFNGGSDRAASDAAASRRYQLVAARKDQYQLIEEQIRDTWSQYQTSGKQIQTFTDAVHFNKKTRDAYQQQFVVGQRSLLDLLDSENEFFQTSGHLITAKVNEIIAVYRLLALSGCLLSSLEVDSQAYGIAQVSGNCCNNVQSIDNDGDGDGVPDDKDRCPNTPAGANVDAQGCPLDSDSDGVPDFRDKCPGTQPGTAVDTNGCAPDSDGDGVPNPKDRCPGTPAGVMVDAKGCPKKEKPQASKSAQVTSTGTFLYKDIKFETNKWDLKSSSYDVLDEIAAWLKSKPNLMVEIQGHSDSRGKRWYNIVLSQKRAQAIIAFLVHKGIDAGRMTPKGYGPDRPIGSNDTAAGRAQNRRVEIKPLQW
jgi:adhesin transport system outer membrane protein